MQHPLVIIGGVAAGMSAASKARRLQPDLPVVVFEKSEYVSYGACGIPYYLSDVIPDHNKMVIRTPQYYDERLGIAVLTKHEVLSIDTEAKELQVKDLDSGEIKKQPYSKLIYATGARAIVPNLPGVDLPGVYTLRTLNDGLKVKDALASPSVKRVVIVGAGYIGLEVAENLRLLGKEVQVIEKAERLLVNFDSEFSQIVSDELERNQVHVHTGEGLVAFRGNERVEAVVTEKGEYPCDLAILSIGVRPNCELAHNAGIKVGFKGAVVVDRQMRTNVPDVFAAGDCAETYHRLLHKNVYIPLGTTANRQGRLAGQNACGAPEEFAGVLGTSVAKIFDLAVSITGLTEETARDFGFDVLSTTVTTLDHAIYYPNPRKIRIKLVYDRKTATLLGGQIVGHEGVAHRADILATAITNGMTLGEFAEVDMCYAPPYKGVWEALTVAANVAETEWQQQK
ncbi:CoA-disulfide reductase [Dethiobacter alkaliphilus]|uniref:FAD-dependent pyridine nucleotide-disulphide oxidoreductase n=1 Tax=Dethiobacter alkaliphilus AHT 1 TaxID=555088 RepID=C0GC38_DETAL|nr:CoA-disulfide reductase [Dethiobacter alkaliphilus]EEG78773.1 FAD-dependent pyridine nucleotide-disulphide oxidoreductase [Dethiobacter alkaliphilus AHT 1]